MSATAPVAIEQLEEVFSNWVRSSTGATPYFEEPEDSGAPTPPPPCAQISWFDPQAISAPMKITIPSIMIQRYTVTTAGAGIVGVDFRLGFDEPELDTEISITAGAGNSEADSAIELLAELDAELPAGVTAAADPEDTSSVLVTGSEDEPLFAAGPVDAGMLTVTTPLERFPQIEADWSRMTWRTSWRATPTRGLGTAGALLMRARKDIHRVLVPQLHAAGWRFAGIAATLTPSATRGDSVSLATLDLGLEGWATAAYQAPAMRLAGLNTVIGP